MANDTKYLDLDATDPSETEIVIKLGGKEHKLKPMTVADFIANTKDVEALGTDPSYEAEFNTVIKMLLRTFPTMDEAKLREIPMAKLDALLKFAQEAGGQKKVEEEAASAQGNPPAAG